MRPDGAQSVRRVVSSGRRAIDVRRPMTVSEPNRKAHPMTVTSSTRDPHRTVPLADDRLTRWHEQTEYEVEVAYHDGYRQACIDIAAGHAELDAVWRNVGRLTYEQRVADRIAEMEACAATVDVDRDRANGRRPWNTWVGEYAGGAVDFETGRPVSVADGAA